MEPEESRDPLALTLLEIAPRQSRASTETVQDCKNLAAAVLEDFYLPFGGLRCHQRCKGVYAG